MFGSDKHENAVRLKKLEARALIFNTIASNANNETIVVGNHILKVSFIEKIKKSKRNDQAGTDIYYFNFKLNEYSEYLVDTIFIPEAKMPFDSISKALDKNKEE